MGSAIQLWAVHLMILASVSLSVNRDGRIQLYLRSLSTLKCRSSQSQGHWAHMLLCLIGLGYNVFAVQFFLALLMCQFRLLIPFIKLLLITGLTRPIVV